jgi:hypothetical protein
VSQTVQLPEDVAVSQTVQLAKDIPVAQTVQLSRNTEVMRLVCREDHYLLYLSATAVNNRLDIYILPYFLRVINWRTNYIHYWRINIIHALSTEAYFKYGDRSQSWLRSRNSPPPPPPAFGLIYERALLVSQDRHLFVTPCTGDSTIFLTALMRRSIFVRARNWAVPA